MYNDLSSLASRLYPCGLLNIDRSPPLSDFAILPLLRDDFTAASLAVLGDDDEPSQLILLDFADGHTPPLVQSVLLDQYFEHFDKSPLLDQRTFLDCSISPYPFMRGILEEFPFFRLNLDSSRSLSLEVSLREDLDFAELLASLLLPHPALETFLSWPSFPGVPPFDGLSSAFFQRVCIFDRSRGRWASFFSFQVYSFIG